MTQIDRYLIISATVFAVVALAHVVRAFAQWSIVIGPMTVPVGLSWVGAAVAAALSAWAFSLRGRKR